METLSMVSCIVTSLMLLFGFTGNVVVTLIWSQKDSLCNPYATNLALLDILVILTGPATNLASVIFGSDWLANHVAACDVIGFLNTHALLGSAVALCFLGEYSRHAHNFSIFRNRHKSKKYLLIGISWLLPLMASLPPLIGWGSFRFDSSLRSCAFCTSSLHPAKRGHVYLFLLVYFLFSLITCILNNHNSRRLHYAAQVNWEVHMLEMRMNDPECTTAHSTSSTIWSERYSVPSLVQSISQFPQVHCLTSVPGENTIETAENERRKRGENEEEQRGKEEESKVQKGSEEKETEMKREVQEDGNKQQQTTSQKNSNAKERRKNDSQKQTGGGDGNGDAEQKQGATNLTPEGKDQQSTEQESYLEATKNSHRFVPKSLELPPQRMLNDLYHSSHKKLQSPRIVHSPVVNRAQRDMITLVLVTAFISLIGCLPCAILNVLQLVLVRCPEILWILAKWLLYVRSAIAPVAYYFCVSEYRRGFGSKFSRCCVCHTADTHESRGSARQEDMQNHVALSDPPNIICRSFEHTSNL